MFQFSLCRTDSCCVGDENEVSLQQRVSQLETRNRGLEEELAMEKTRGIITIIYMQMCISD